MSAESAAAFVDKASQDPDLAQQVWAEAGAHGEPIDLAHLTDQQYAAVAPVAQRNGYQVTPGEVRDAFGNYLQAHPEVVRELSETELDLVAGGGTPACNPSQTSGMDAVKRP